MVAPVLQQKRLPRLLVVEDDLATRATLERYFEAHRFEVSAAASGDEALALFSFDAFDAVILDLMVPRVDGHELVKRFRALPAPRCDVPIVVTTGMSGVAVPDVQAMFTKPVSLAELLERVERLVEQASTS